MRIYYVFLICIIFISIALMMPSCGVQNKDIHAYNSNTPTPIPTLQPTASNTIASNLAPSLTSSPSPSVVPTPPYPPLNPPQPTLSQQQIVDGIVSDLKQQVIIILSTRFVDFAGVDPPVELEFTLQSNSNDFKGAPDDAINIPLVERAASLAQLKGLDIGAIGVVFINQQGQQISAQVSRAVKPQLNNGPSSLDDVTLFNLLKQQIYLPAPSTVNIKIFQDYYGLREASFDIQVPDLPTANSDIAIVSKIIKAVENLNSTQNAQITVFRINITDATGDPLLKLMDDLTTGPDHVSAWYAEGLANWGYPAPPSAPVPVSSSPSD